MADDGSPQPTTIWQQPKFHFQVKWDSNVMSFQEVLGLEIEGQPIEYRSGNSEKFSPVKMPGIQRGNMTMKMGVFKSDKKIWDWLNQANMNTIEQALVTVSLLDEGGSPTMVWTLSNAWPTKITGTEMGANGNEVAVASIEIGYESLTIANS